MKKFIICVALLASAEASARDAQVSVYLQSAPRSFQLIVPGRSTPSPQEVPAANEVDLAGQFEAIAPPAPLPAARLAIDVPAWMRQGRATLSPFQLHQVPSFVGTGCGDATYRPYAGLSPSGEARRRVYFRDMAHAACEAGVPVELLDSLIVQESRYNPRALSPAGAIGIAQLMPGTARDLRVHNPWDPAANLRGAARYLRQQLDEFDSWHLALSAYNAGPGAVRRHRGIPPYRETVSYVRAILASVRLNARAGQVEGILPGRRVAHLSYLGS